MSYKVVYTKQAQADAKKLKHTLLAEKVRAIIHLISKDPFIYPPDYKILHGDFKGAISRRINKQHRFVYQVYEEEKVIKVIRMWTHYE